MRLILILFFFFYVLLFWSQDLHFSQWDENPALINPALTGASAPLRASLSYKDQWRSAIAPYKSFGMSFDTRLSPGHWQQVDEHRGMTFKERSFKRLAAGLSVYTAKDGIGSLGSTSSQLSLATFVPIHANQFLSFGLQTGIVQRRLDNSGFLYPNQFNGTYYDPGMSSNEKVSSFYYWYPDLSLGILWSFKKETQRIAEYRDTRAHLGFAIYHLLPQREKFLQSNHVINSRYVIHGDLQLNVANRNLAVVPSFLVQVQTKAYEVVAGCMLKYFYHFNSKYTGLVKRTSFNAGVYYRYGDALIFKTLYDLGEHYGIGISYDVVVSSLNKATQGRGGFELSLRYCPAKGFLYEEKNSPSN